MKKIMNNIVLILFLVSWFPSISQTAPGAIIFSEDFNGGLPSTWSVVNNNPNNLQWIWETNYRQGQFSNCFDKIASSTSDNGFMLLPMDFYNTPSPSIGAVSMDTYIESPSIIIPNNAQSILFRFQHYVRYCCSNTGKLEVHYSFDNFLTSQSHDVVQHLPINSLGENVAEVGVTVARLSGQGNSVRFRILAEGMSNYFWMIDDVVVVMPYSSAVSVEHSEIINENMVSSPSLQSAVPLLLMDAINSIVKVQNRGLNAQTGLSVQSTLYLDSNLTGQVLNSVISTDFGTIPFLGIDSMLERIVTNQNSPSVHGHYRLKNEVVTNGLNQLSNRKYKEVQFQITDSVLSKNTNIATCANELSTDGGISKFGTVYAMKSRGGQLSSMSAYVGASTFNVGAYVRAEIWSYDASETLPNLKVGILLDSSEVDTLHSADLSKWHTFMLSGRINLSPDSNYLVVINQVGRSAQSASFHAPVYMNSNHIRNSFVDS